MKAIAKNSLFADSLERRAFVPRGAQTMRNSYSSVYTYYYTYCVNSLISAIKFLLFVMFAQSKKINIVNICKNM